MNCRLCASGGVRKLFIAQDIHGRHILSEDKFAIVQCEACGVTFTEVETDSDYYKKYYRKNYYPPLASNKLIANTLSFFQRLSFNQRLKLIDKFKNLKGSRILEIGCGKGEFLRFLPQRFEKSAVEINEDGCEYIRKHSKDITVYNVHLDDETVDISGYGQFDIIIMWHVFEHVVNPAVFVKNIERLLNPEGVLIFEIPNRDSLGFNLTKKKWFHLDAPRHLFHYSYKSISKMIEKSDLKIIYCKANINDYPQDLPFSVYMLFKGNNRLYNCLVFVFVVPFFAVIRLFVSLFFRSMAELNTYIVKHKTDSFDLGEK
ncbi:MAG: class I SAM-dependent methyltransferase [Candidatus Omnitrophica bacterium]|nr:class I SAM-dependent methyltransferase [Candidatus Omnitrophota bacterium]